MANKDPLVVSKKLTIELYGISLTTLDRWIVYGLPINKVGRSVKIDLRLAVKWRESYLTKDGGLNPQAQKARLDKARADKTELEYKKMSSQVVDIAAAAKLLEQVIVSFRLRTLALPTKAAPLVHGAKSIPAAQQILQVCIDELLTELGQLNDSDLYFHGDGFMKPEKRT